MSTNRWPFIMESLDDYIFTFQRCGLHLFIKPPKFLKDLGVDLSQLCHYRPGIMRTIDRFKNQLNRIPSVRDIVDIDPIEIKIRAKEDKYTPISIQWPEGTIQKHRKYILEENLTKKKKR